MAPIKKIFQYINIIGKYSLPIYLFHSFFIMIGQKYFILKYLDIAQNQIAYTFIYALWMISFAIFPAIIIKKYSSLVNISYIRGGYLKNESY